MTVLGIDLGTSGVKVVLADAAGRVLAQSGREYPVERPEPGWAESDPRAWWSAVRAAVAEVGGAPSAIGLSGQMHGVVLVDEAGAPVRPAILWEDARAASQVDTLRSLGPAVAARLANPLSPGMAGPILAWLVEHEPDRIARAHLAVQPKDWLRGRLTGTLAGEPSDASATLLYDLPGDRWDHAVAGALGIPTILLPPLLPHSGALAGRLRPDAAAELGLPPGIPVAAGAGDTPAGAIGAGLTAPGSVQLTIGTGVQLVTPVVDLVASSVTHVYRAATRHGWYAMAAGLTGGATLSWVRRLFAVDWTTLYAAAARPPRPDDPVFLPHLIGERTPYLDPAMRGAWTGLDARHDREALLYAALEGVAFAIADGLDALPGRPTALRLAGGGSTHPAWRALLADVLRADLHAVDTPSASARGAALLGAIAAGRLDERDLAATAPPTSLVARPGPGQAALEARRARYRHTLTALR